MATPAPRTIAPRVPRITLASVSTRANTSPLRLLIHGVEGVGKTTLGASAPGAIILGPEDGIPRALGEVPHFPAPEGGWCWPDVVDAVRALATSDHAFKSLVIDTLDWLEPLLWRDVCERNKVDSIEDVGGGFGKGYVAALDGWRSFIAELETLRRSKNMNIILLAHTTIRSFKNPTGEDFDRFEMKLNAKAAGLWKEWPDAVLFACHDDVVSKDARTKRTRGVSTGARVLRTVHHAAYDAKNRFGLPEELSLSWEALEQAMGGDRTAELKASITALLAEVPEAVAGKARDALVRAGDDVNKLAQLDNWLAQQKGA